MDFGNLVNNKKLLYKIGIWNLNRGGVMKFFKLFLVFVFIFSRNYLYAYQSKPASVLFENEIDIFGTLKYETDWMPQNSPISLKFILTLGGKLGSKLKGIADLSWPPSFNHKFKGEKDGGIFWVNYGLSVAIKIKFNIGGYSGEFDVPYDPLSSLKFDAQRNFTPFVLKGAEERPIALEDNIGKIILADTSFTVLQVVDIKFHVDTDATFNATLTGEWIEEDGKKIEVEGGVNEVSFKNGGDFNIDAIYAGTYSGIISLHFYPTAEVCVPIGGCTPLAVFDIPVELTANSKFEKFKPLKITHPLPDIEVGGEKISFADVKINSVGNFPLVIKNKGKMLLEGKVELKDGDVFSIFPEEFLITEGKEGGVMVSFSPKGENSYSGAININSNDPDMPVITLTMDGKGVKEKIPPPQWGEIIEGEVLGEVEPSVIPSPEGCGCSIYSGSEGNIIFSSLILIFAFFIIIKRRAGSGNNG